MILPQTSTLVIESINHSSIRDMVKMATRDRVTCADTSHSIWLGAFLGSQIIGFTGVSFGQKEIALLRAIYILPAYRQRGHGTQLLKAAIALAKSRSVTRIKALVYEPKFYAPQGFQVTDSYQIKCGTVYRMERPLKS